MLKDPQASCLWFAPLFSGLPGWRGTEAAHYPPQYSEALLWSPNTHLPASLVLPSASGLVDTCVCASYTHFNLVRLFATPWAVAYQAPLCMGFVQKEYWSGLLCPPPGDLPNPGIKPASPLSPELQVGSLLLSHWGSLPSDLRLRQIKCTDMTGIPLCRGLSH